MANWPFTIADPVRAVHFALEPDFPCQNPAVCGREAGARRATEAYQQWQAAQQATLPTTDTED